MTAMLHGAAHPSHGIQAHTSLRYSLTPSAFALSLEQPGAELHWKVPPAPNMKGTSRLHRGDPDLHPDTSLELEAWAGVRVSARAQDTAAHPTLGRPGVAKPHQFPALWDHKGQ